MNTRSTSAVQGVSFSTVAKLSLIDIFSRRSSNDFALAITFGEYKDGVGYVKKTVPVAFTITNGDAAIKTSDYQRLITTILKSEPYYIFLGFAMVGECSWDNFNALNKLLPTFTNDSLYFCSFWNIEENSYKHFAVNNIVLHGTNPSLSTSVPVKNIEAVGSIYSKALSGDVKTEIKSDHYNQILEVVSEMKKEIYSK